MEWAFVVAAALSLAAALALAALLWQKRWLLGAASPAAATTAATVAVLR